MEAGRLPVDIGKEMEALLQMAAWYRSWAAITESGAERENRLALAATLERKARGLEPPASAGERSRNP